MRQSNSRAPAAAASGATAHGGGRAGEGGERGRRRKADEGTEKGEQETRDREGRTQETRKEKVAPLESSGRGGRHDGRESKRLPPGWTSMRRGRARRATPEELLLHPVAPLPISGGTKGGLVGATPPYHAEKALNPLYYMHAPEGI
jgi:hypothetical protein